MCIQYVQSNADDSAFLFRDETVQIFTGSMVQVTISNAVHTATWQFPKNVLIMILELTTLRYRHNKISLVTLVIK
jgi:hypothetical protein